MNNNLTQHNNNVQYPRRGRKEKSAEDAATKILLINLYYVLMLG